MLRERVSDGGAWAGEVRERFSAVRDATVALREHLEIEDHVAQSMADASPLSWHLAHTTWFFETFVLVPHARGYRTRHPAYGYLFNSYYEAVGGRNARTRRGLMTRPTVAEILRYREAVDGAVARLLDSPTGEAVAGLLELGLAHEQQHQELMLTDVAHLFSLHPQRPAYREADRASHASAGGESEPLRWIPFRGGLEGFGHAGPGFAFDNEGPRHDAFVAPFELASRPATCGEFLEFVEDRGYERPELWLSDGWAAARSEGWTAPLYWERDGAGWAQFTLQGMRSVDPHEPVTHVGFYEADAFARWSGARLPDEREWELAARGVELDGNFADGGALHPRRSPRAAGLSAMFGDVWEWTASAYSPYPGYRPAPGALGEYNGKFMCNQLVLRGGSCATPRGHVRATYRNFFPPGARWQFSGIRLARDARGRSARTGRE
jgi:ergothioneine biosynthesis protein EgtB